MMEKLAQIWKAKDLRQSIIYVLAMLVIFRIVAHIPIPGVNVSELGSFLKDNQVLGLLNLFSGGGIETFSIVMMSVGPYITASIIFQLLGMIVPALEEMNKEESGRQKINMWTRWLTVPMAMLQSYGMITILQRTGRGIITSITPFDMILMIISITAGTVFVMWLGELISEKKIGNGISLLIFAGIVARIPNTIQSVILSYDPSKLQMIIGFSLIAIITIVAVVIISEGQRNVPVQYAKQIRGNRMYGGSNSHLPLRVNMAGVIPIIFAVSVAMFPPLIAQFFLNAKSAALVKAATWVVDLFQNNQLFYGVLYFVLVFAFTFFYTEVVFHPAQIAENLQKQGGFIPGIRPGRHTAEYLAYTTYKIMLAGALFLSLIAILPLILKYFTGNQSLAIGGTSLLIVVSVVIETVKQIESQLTMRQYDGL
ncbi:MAG: preprotein translocase subunit SecY [Candidatus Falkowbacteria bacterium]